jgi:GH25 family lysozyme M1 (1,4-beta-N-acetylmuramidase)
MRQGIDLYDGIEVNDWEQAKDSGLVQFVLHKASEGETIQDSKFNERKEACEALGIPFEGYLYDHPIDDPTKMAENCLAVIGGPNPIKRLWVDLEWATREGLKGCEWDLTTEIGRMTSLQTLVAVIEAEGIKTGFYTSLAFMNQYFPTVGKIPFFSSRPLWLAGEGNQPTALPAPWAGGSWTYWQHKCGILVPGIQNPVDSNYAGDMVVLGG